MFSKKRQIIKFDQNLCNASVNDNSVLFVRVNGLVTDKDAIVEIPFTHNAFIIKSGSDLRFYERGPVEVFDNRSEVKDWKRGLSVEVIYMPKNTSVLILWGTPEKVKYRDKASNKVVNVGARGQFGISIVNPQQFFEKVVGVRKEFDLVDFRKRFGAAVVSEFGDCFLQVVDEQALTYDRFDAKKKEIALKVNEMLSPKFAKSWGIELVDFIIEAFNISQEDMDAVEDAAAEAVQRNRIKEYLAELERLDDKQWERDKYLKQLELQDRNAYYEVMKVIGHAPAGMPPVMPSTPMAPGTPVTPVMPGTVVGGGFCPDCGNPLTPGAAFCSKCGKKLPTNPVCPNCHNPVDGASAFCPKCGTRLK